MILARCLMGPIDGRIPALIAAALTGMWLPPAGAAFVVVDAGTRPIGVAAPLLPTSASQCNEFAAEVAAISQGLNRRHETCLRNESRKGHAPSHKGQCSFPACEPVHLAMLRFTSASSKEVTDCHARAQQVAREVRDAMSAFSSVQEAQAQFLNTAPLAVKKMQATLRQAIEQQMHAAIGRVREQLTPSEASRTAQDISLEVMKAAAVCRRELGTARSIECEKQGYLSIASLQAIAPFATQGSPIVVKIQSEAFQHLNRINQETLQRIQALSQISEEGEDNNEGSVSLGR
jgi:hypothetical protein